MSEIVIHQLVAVLREGFEGPGKYGYFLDEGAGLRSTLAGLDAAAASRDIGGTSIAAHAHHVLFGLDAFAAFISGDRSKKDWNESWRVKTVDDDAWRKLQSDLDAGHARLRETIEQNAAASEAQLGGALGAVTHVAYHVGAIRQKLAALR